MANDSETFGLEDNMLFAKPRACTHIHSAYQNHHVSAHQIGGSEHSMHSAKREYTDGRGMMIV